MAWSRARRRDRARSSFASSNLARRSSSSEATTRQARPGGGFVVVLGMKECCGGGGEGKSVPPGTPRAWSAWSEARMSKKDMLPGCFGLFPIRKKLRGQRLSGSAL